VLTFIWTLNNTRLTFLLVRDKYEIIIVRQNAKHLKYKHHELIIAFQLWFV